MPLRTVTLKDGTKCTRMIRNFHPDGTEFLPEETVLPRNEITEPAFRILEHCLEILNQRDAEAAAKAEAEKGTPTATE